MRRFIPLVVIVSLLLAAASAPALTPAYFQSQRFGGTGSDYGYFVTTSDSGYVYVTGSFQGTVDFGGGNLVSAGNDDIFLAKYDAGGSLVWAKRFGSTGFDQGHAVGVDCAGNVYLLGSFQGSVYFENVNPLVSAGSYDIVLAKYRAGGGHLWSKRFGGTAVDQGASMDVTCAGNIVITGSFQNTIDFGGGALSSAASDDVYLAKFDANGIHTWSERFGGAGSDVGSCVVTDGSGNVLVTGNFGGTVDFGGGGLVSAGGNDVFLAKCDANGTHVWSQRFGSTSSDVGLGVAVDGSGNVSATGYFSLTVDFGGGALVSAGSWDGFVARYDPAGSHLWSRRLGGPSTDLARSIASDAADNVVVTGYFQDTVDFGGESRSSAGGSDIFAVKYGADGSYVWSQGFGGPYADNGRWVYVDALGNVYLTGTFTGTADLGGGDLTSAGGIDIFVARYSSGPAEPRITSITDIGNDQGRNLLLEFNRSGHDDPRSMFNVTSYEAYRRIDPPPAGAAIREPAGLSPRQLAILGWTQVDSVAAHGEAGYSMVVPTIGDSTVAQGQYYSVYFVRAATSSPYTFFDSEPDSGYSLDNLAPGVPTNFVYNAGQLSWDASPAEDFDYFTVYGSNMESFEPATLINYTTGSSMDVTASPYAYYYLTATDFSGNEGEPATVSTFTGAGDTPASYVLSVSNYPNPFNPTTTVRYTVPSRGPVTVAIYDARGARVATLVDHEERDAGAYRDDWNGRMDSGTVAASGIYFARIEHLGAVRTKKMTLLK